MKTKKLLAIVTLVAFMMSILPTALFAADFGINNFASVISVDVDEAQASDADYDDDGIEVELVAVSGAAAGEGGETAYVYVGTTRNLTDVVYYDDGDNWVPAYVVETEEASDDYIYEIPVAFAEGVSVVSTDIKIVSETSGTFKFAIGTDALSTYEYVAGKDFTAGGIADIITQKQYTGTFTAADVTDIDLTTDDNGKDIYANGVNYWEVTAYVSANGYPVSGETVDFSLSGTGAVLSKASATTGTNGKATVKVTATKPGTYTITAEAGDEDTDTDLTFLATGVVNIDIADDNNQKIAIIDDTKEFEYKLYDAAGNKVDVQDLDDFDVVVLSAPIGSKFEDDDITLVDDDGTLLAEIDLDDLDKDGTYSFKVYLTNGKGATYTFSAAEQGDVTKMTVKYDSTSYSTDSIVPAPTVKYQDADGYETEATASDLDDVTFSVNDATFVKSWDPSGNGALTLEDKLGTFTVTAVDADKELVATTTISVQKAASYLVLSAPSFTAIGEEAKVTIQLVDGDGKAVSTGLDAIEGSKAIILSKSPSNAIVSDPDLDTDDFADDGTASVTLSSNLSGTVVIQVVIKEDETKKVYTGSATVAFGIAASAADKDNLTMFIGAKNYMVGNTAGISDAAPFIENGRTMVAVRPIAEALKASLTWDEATKTVVMTTGSETLTIVIGAPTIKVTRGGVVTEYPCDAPAMIKDGRTYLPFRCIGEAMGYTVNFYAETGAVMFTK